MQSKTSLFNRGLFIQDLRNVGWIGVVYFLVLFFAVPLHILMLYTRTDDYYKSYLFTESLFRVGEEFQIISMFAVPVLLGIFLFRYLQVKLSADYIHSLPIKRQDLYHQHILFGLVTLVVPVLINTIILLVMSSFIDGGKILTLSSIGTWMGTTLLIVIFVFIATVLVGMFTGMSVLQGVLTFILLIFPAGVTVLFFMNVKFYLFGFAVDYYLSNKLEQIVIFVKAANLAYTPLEAKEVIILILFIIAMNIIALFVYLRRKVEAATQAIAFRPLQPVFLYGVTFCTMLLGGLYFGETQNSLGWLIFGYIFASIIGYFVALMIMEKTWRVLTKWKGYGLFVAAMCLIAFFIHVDVTGYENRLPEAQSIERVYFAESLYQMDQDNYYTHYEEPYPTNFYYEEEANIERILALHKHVIENKDIYEKMNKGNRRYAAFGYELDNGKKLVRYYQLPADFYEEQNELYVDIVESQEHKQNIFSVMKLEDSADIDKITIVSHRGTKNVTIADKDDIDSFHKILQTEISESTYDEVLSKRGTWAGIEYLLSDDHRIHTNWVKSYDQIESWLKERDLLSEARVTADDIAYAVVAKNDKQGIYEYEKIFHEKGNFELENGIKIEDHDQIE